MFVVCFCIYVLTQDVYISMSRNISFSLISNLLLRFGSKKIISLIHLFIVSVFFFFKSQTNIKLRDIAVASYIYRFYYVRILYNDMFNIIYNIIAYALINQALLAIRHNTSSPVTIH